VPSLPILTLISLQASASAVAFSGWDGADRRSSSGSPLPLRSPLSLRALRHARITMAGTHRAPELARQPRELLSMNSATS
jgi:hypothetical protein